MAKVIENSKKFVREVRSEMMKVTWPSWPELKGSTILVMAVSFFFAVYLFVVDNILALMSRMF